MAAITGLKTSDWQQQADIQKPTLGGPLSTFTSYFRNGKKGGVSLQNLFSVQFAHPNCMEYAKSNIEVPGGLSLYDQKTNAAMVLYCNEVNVPTRNIMTSEAKVVGSSYQYATGTSFSEISMNFIVPRNYMQHAYFERWMQIMANDANSYVSYYDDYCTPLIRIFKFERGGNPAEFIPIDETKLTSEQKKQLTKSARPVYNTVTAIWELYNVFPKNIGAVQFNNQTANIVTVDITFQYERYRFYPKPTASYTADIANSQFQLQKFASALGL